MYKTKVLLVDDHAIVREGIRSLLDAREDIEVIGEAEDGRQAVKKAGELTPDIILIDITMPNLKGIAHLLKLSTKTVEVHRFHIMEKLHIRNITGLVKYSIRTGLIEA